MEKLKKVSSRNKILSGFLLTGLIVLGISITAFIPDSDKTMNSESEEVEVLSHTAQHFIRIYGADGDGTVYWRYPVNHATETEEIVYADFEDGTPIEIAEDIVEELNIDLDINIIADAYYVSSSEAYVCIQEKRTGSQYEGNRANLGNFDGNLIYHVTSVLLDEPGTCPS